MKQRLNREEQKQGKLLNEISWGQRAANRGVCSMTWQQEKLANVVLDCASTISCLVLGFVTPGRS